MPDAGIEEREILIGSRLFRPAPAAIIHVHKLLIIYYHAKVYTYRLPRRGLPKRLL